MTSRPIVRGLDFNPERVQLSLQERLLYPFGYNYTIGSPQNFFREQSLHLNPAHTPSKCSIAESSSDGSSVSIPASKFLVFALFMPMRHQ